MLRATQRGAKIALSLTRGQGCENIAHPLARKQGRVKITQTVLRWNSTKAQQLDEADCTMFFDGGCPLCHREVAFYEKLDSDNKVNFLDISTLQAEPPGLVAYGVSLQHAMERIHVLDRGEMVSGAKAFLSLWEKLPYFHLLVPLFHIPGVLVVTEYAYCYFAKNRLAATGRCNPHNRE